MPGSMAMMPHWLAASKSRAVGRRLLKRRPAIDDAAGLPGNAEAPPAYRRENDVAGAHDAH